MPYPVNCTGFKTIIGKKGKLFQKSRVAFLLSQKRDAIYIGLSRSGRRTPYRALHYTRRAFILSKSLKALPRLQRLTKLYSTGVSCGITFDPSTLSIRPAALARCASLSLARFKAASVTSPIFLRELSSSSSASIVTILENS